MELKSRINLQILIREFKLNKKLGILGLDTNLKNNINKKNSFNHKIFKNELNMKSNLVCNFDGSSFVIRNSLPIKSFYFNEKLFLYCEEFYQSYKIIKNGYFIKNLNLANLYHYSSFKNYSVYYQIRNFILIFKNFIFITNIFTFIFQFYTFFFI